MTKISITGHRDLKEIHIESYKQKIKEYILSIMTKSNKSIKIITPLADGADRLIAYVSIELGLEFEVLLPMPRELYIQDFDNASLEEFIFLESKASSITTMPLYWDNTIESISSYGIDRDYQYSEVGRTLAKETDYLIALWDKIDNQKWGGTAHVVKMRKEYYYKDIFIVEVERFH